jgi:CubicO group peptidase (beta-lactamase class C family)
MLEPAPAADVARCDRSTVFITATDPPGTQFTYSSTGPTIAARVVELLTGQPFETAFQERIAEPLGMGDTSFTKTPGGEEADAAPDPAAGAVSSADDYLRFVQMLDQGGRFDSNAVLSPASTSAMLRIETAHAHFKDDPTAADLDSAGYGLGAWVESAEKDGAARLIDGSGAYGTYPWIDEDRGVYGIVLVYDSANPGPTGAVAESHDDVAAVGRTLDALARADAASSP